VRAFNKVRVLIRALRIMRIRIEVRF